MFQNLTLFSMANAMARHAGARQALIAQNMANADTPGYRPQDLPAFASLVAGSGPRDGAPQRRSRTGHLAPLASSVQTSGTRTGATQSPNGNAVSVEEELLRSVEAKRQHDRALAIYRSGLSMLRASLGSR